MWSASFSFPSGSMKHVCAHISPRKRTFTQSICWLPELCIHLNSAKVKVLQAARFGEWIVTENKDDWPWDSESGWQELQRWLVYTSTVLSVLYKRRCLSMNRRTGNARSLHIRIHSPRKIRDKLVLVYQAIGEHRRRLLRQEMEWLLEWFIINILLHLLTSPRGRSCVSSTCLQIAVQTPIFQLPSTDTYFRWYCNSILNAVHPRSVCVDHTKPTLCITNVTSSIQLPHFS